MSKWEKYRVDGIRRTPTEKRQLDRRARSMEFSDSDEARIAAATNPESVRQGFQHDKELRDAGQARSDRDFNTTGSFFHTLPEADAADKSEAFAYGAAKRLGKVIDTGASVAHLAQAGGAKVAEKVLGGFGENDITRGLNEFASSEYDKAGDMWDNPHAEKFIEEKLRPEYYDKWTDRSQYDELKRWESSGEFAAMVPEFALTGGVIRGAGKGFVVAAETYGTAKYGEAIKTIAGTKPMQWLNKFLNLDVTTLNVVGAAGGGYGAELLREDSHASRAESPLEDAGRIIAGSVVGDVAVRGTLGAATGAVKGTAKVVGKHVIGKENLEKSVNALQETVGSWVNGLTFLKDTKLTNSVNKGLDSLAVTKEIAKETLQTVEYLQKGKTHISESNIERSVKLKTQIEAKNQKLNEKLERTGSIDEDRLEEIKLIKEEIENNNALIKNVDDRIKNLSLNAEKYLTGETKENFYNWVYDKDNFKSQYNKDRKKPVSGNFYTWMVNKGDTTLDDKFIESISPGLLSTIKNKGDKKEILKTIEKNPELLNAFTIYKNNTIPESIALNYPNYIYEKKILEKLDMGALRETNKMIENNNLKINLRDPDSNFARQTQLLEENIYSTNKILSDKRNELHSVYKDVLQANPNITISLTDSIEPLTKLANKVRVFAATPESEKEGLSRVSVEVQEVLDKALGLGNKQIDNGNVVDFVKNSVNPLELLNKRQVINELIYGEKSANSPTYKLLHELIEIIDESIKTNSGDKPYNLPLTFEAQFKAALNFDSDIYFTYIKNDIIKSLLDKSPSTNLSALMERSVGRDRIKKALEIHDKPLVEMQTRKIINQLRKERGGFGKTYYDSKKQASINVQNAIDRVQTDTLNEEIKQAQETIRKNAEIYKTLQKLKLQEIFFEKITEDPLKHVEKTQWAYESFLNEVLGEKVASKFAKNMPMIVEKIRNVKSNFKNKPDSPILNAFGGNSVAKLATTALTTAVGGSLTANPITGFMVGGVGAATFNMLIGKGFAKAASDPKTILRMIELSQQKKDFVLINYLLKLANDNKAVLDKPSTKVGAYKAREEDNRNVLTPSGKGSWKPSMLAY